MSSRRRSSSISSSRQQNGNNIASSRSIINDDQIIDLVSKLQLLIPPDHHGHPTRSSNKVSASKILQETCSYIRNLHREVDDLSDRLSELLASTEIDSRQADLHREVDDLSDRLSELLASTEIDSRQAEIITSLFQHDHVM